MAQPNTTKIVKESLDKASTEMIRISLGIDNLSYYIDKTACICWIGSGSYQNIVSVSSIDCKRLRKHESLSKYLEKCE